MALAFFSDPAPADPRVFQSDVEQLVHLYREVAERTATARIAGGDPRGEIVVLAGERGSGRPGLIQALIAALRRQKHAPTVFGGRFSRDRFEPWPCEPTTRVPIKQILTLVGTAMPLAKDIVQVMEFIGQVVQTSTAGWDTLNMLNRQHEGALDSGEGIVTLLRAATRKDAAVVVLDGYDRADGSWWNSLLLDRIAPAIATSLPIVLIVGVDLSGGLDATPPAPSSPTAPNAADRPSDLVYTLDRLAQRWGAQRLTLPPFGSEEIASWLGRADADLVEQLLAVTGGNPGRLWELWQDWERRGVVKRPLLRRRWRFAVPLAASSVDATHDFVNQILDERLARLIDVEDRRARDELKDLLGRAALEGHEFTVEALAQAVERDPAELVDLFSLLVVHDRRRPDGVLERVPDLTLHDPRKGQKTLHRFAFASDLFRFTLLRGQYGLADADRPDASLKLARALLDLYHPDEHRIATTVAQLFLLGGDTQEAARYQRMSDFHPGRHVEALRAQALALMAAPKDDWDEAELLRATATLIEAGRAMLYVYPYDETLAVFETAYDLARASGNRDDQAYTLYRRSDILISLSRYEAARSDLERAMGLFGELGDRAFEAVCVLYLGFIHHCLGDLETAQEKYEQALQVFQARGDRSQMSRSLFALGQVYHALGELEAARAKHEQALTIDQELGDRLKESPNWYALGVIDRKLRNYPAAREKIERSLAMARGLGDRQTEAAAWRALGEVDYDLADYSAARAKFERSLAIYQELGDHRAEALTWHPLGLLDEEIGEFEAAQAEYEQALAICEEFGLPEAVTVRKALKHLVEKIAVQGEGEAAG
jgi:tetratricopeptide (TPR) repeat protein